VVEGGIDVGSGTVGVAGSGGAEVVDVSEVEATESAATIEADVAGGKVLVTDVVVIEVEVEVPESVVATEVGVVDSVEVDA